MKLETAIKQLQKEAGYLGVSVNRVKDMIQTLPSAFPKKTVDAFRTLESVKLA
jgi:hypothetical protein